MSGESEGIGGRRRERRVVVVTAVEAAEEDANGDGDEESYEKDEDGGEYARFETIERRRVCAMARVDVRVHCFVRENCL